MWYVYQVFSFSDFSANIWTTVDEFSPCLSCVEAKAPCTHNSIPQKRGPRPRERPGLNTQLEQRLAQLEHLLASIPHSAGALANLSEEERKEIQRAAVGQSAGFNSMSDSPLSRSEPAMASGSGSDGGNMHTPGSMGTPQSMSTSGPSTEKYNPQYSRNLQQPLPPPFDYVPPNQSTYASLEQQFRPRPAFAPAASLSPPPMQQQPSPQHSSSSSANPTAASRRNLIYR